MHLPRKKFDRLVEQAIAALPEEFAKWIDQIPIIVEDAPGTADKDVQDALGFYQGVSLPAKMEDSGHLPPRIVLYRRPLMDACDSIAQLADEIRKTLRHELGHHAGMTEEDLDRLGYGSMEDDEPIDWDLDEEES